MTITKFLSELKISYPNNPAINKTFIIESNMSSIRESISPERGYTPKPFMVWACELANRAVKPCS